LTGRVGEIILAIGPGKASGGADRLAAMVNNRAAGLKVIERSVQRWYKTRQLGGFTSNPFRSSVMSTSTRNLYRLAAMGVCLLAVGCGQDPMSKENYDRIKDGMTTQEVSKLFGFEDVKELEGQIGVLKGKAVSTSPLGIERETRYADEMGYIYDTFTTKEMGGVNKKRIEVRYLDGKVEWKDQSGIE
jgi:hypothetical protein